MSAKWLKDKYVCAKQVHVLSEKLLLKLEVDKAETPTFDFAVDRVVTPTVGVEWSFVYLGTVFRCWWLIHAGFVYFYSIHFC